MMQTEPFVSIIMPAYNSSQTIMRSIDSVMGQTYTNFELIIVDDGSSDDTAILVKEICKTKKNIRYFFQQNSKQGKARNNGIKHANGTLIAFIDADDLWLQEKIAQQVLFLTSTGADMVFSDITVFDENGCIFSDTWHVSDNVFQGEEGIIAFMYENKVPLLTALIKKDVLISKGFFAEDPAMQYVEDYELWIRLLQSGVLFASTSQKLACYTYYSNKSKQRKKTLVNVLNIISAINLRSELIAYHKERAFVVWIKKIARRCPFLSRVEIKSLISYLPAGKIKKGLFLCNLIIGPYVTSKLISYIKPEYYFKKE